MLSVNPVPCACFERLLLVVVIYVYVIYVYLLCTVFICGHICICCKHWYSLVVNTLINSGTCHDIERERHQCLHNNNNN